MNVHYVTADVFTSRAFGGNPLAVFPDAREIPAELMQPIAREFNYSETTFVLPPADPSHTAKVRIFTPGGELQFAGHPTVGTAHVLATIGAIVLTGDETRIVFEEGAVVGAEFMRPDGPLAVRARHGVTVAGGGPYAALATGQALPADDASLRLCLVGQTASRFGRVELLTSAPFTKSVASKCRSVSGRLFVNMHEAHSHLQTWRCGKVDGYPPPGQ